MNKNASSTPRRGMNASPNNPLKAQKPRVRIRDWYPARSLLKRHLTEFDKETSLGFDRTIRLRGGRAHRDPSIRQILLGASWQRCCALSRCPFVSTPKPWSPPSCIRCWPNRIRTPPGLNWPGWWRVWRTAFRRRPACWPMPKMTFWRIWGGSPTNIGSKSRSPIGRNGSIGRRFFHESFTSFDRHLTGRDPRTKLASHASVL